MTEIHPKVLDALKKYNITYTLLACDPDFADTAAFCEKYGFTPEQSANTIVVASRKVEPIKHAVCVVLANTRLNVNKKVCQLLDVKKASFADAEQTVALTGMMIGGVTAIGTENLPIYVDSAVIEQEKIVMGGGNRTSKLVLSPGELRKLPQVEVVPNLAQLK